ncbi:MAG: SDR family oxidoreductase [Xanthomonadales bacterium]|nr:SDR family oxidoreductase [Xanthomonadales bacterium]
MSKNKTTSCMPEAGRVVIITGASKGIGAATAKKLAADGCRVVVSSRSQENCQLLVDEIEQAGGEALAVSCHIGDEEQLQALVDKTINHWGQIDGLVCNAASNPVYGPAKVVDYKAFELIMRNNVYSAMKLTVLAAGHMQSGGAVVIISSIAGLMGSRMIGAYGVSKAAEMALIRNLALDYGKQGIRVNGVAPGLIETDFSSALMNNPALMNKVHNESALGRVGQPDDIAGPICFLLSDCAAFITGQTIIADGGMVIADPL